MDRMSGPEDPDKDFQTLVRRTEGLQPWRRLFHAAGGLLVAGVLQLSVLDTREALGILVVILALMLALDAIRLTMPEMNQTFFRLFQPLASPREEMKLASSTWYVLGVLLTLLLFPLPSALAGIMVLALADPAASVVGRSLGRHTLGKGTWEGSSAFLLVAFLCILPFAPWGVALGGAFIVTLAEIVPWPLDDNLVLPLASAGVLTLLI